MKFTKPIEQAFEKQGNTGDKSSGQIKIVCKLFHPALAATWYLYEKITDDIYMCFANLGDSRMAECGSVSLSELKTIKEFGLGVEVDKFFKPLSMTLEEVINIVKSGGHV